MNPPIVVPAHPSLNRKHELIKGKLILQTQTWPKITTVTTSDLSHPHDAEAAPTSKRALDEQFRGQTSSPTPLRSRRGRNWIQTSSMRRYVCSLRGQLMEHSFFIRFLKEVNPSVKCDLLSALTGQLALYKPSSASRPQNNQPLWPYANIQLFQSASCFTASTAAGSRGYWRHDFFVARGKMYLLHFQLQGFREGAEMHLLPRKCHLPLNSPCLPSFPQKKGRSSAAPCRPSRNISMTVVISEKPLHPKEIWIIDAGGSICCQTN